MAVSGLWSLQHLVHWPPFAVNRLCCALCWPHRSHPWQVFPPLIPFELPGRVCLPHPLLVPAHSSPLYLPLSTAFHGWALPHHCFVVPMTPKSIPLSPDLSSGLHALGCPKGTSDLPPPKFIFSRKPASTVTHLFLWSSVTGWRHVLPQARYPGNALDSSLSSTPSGESGSLGNRLLRLLRKWSGGTWAPAETAPVRAEWGRMGWGN